MSIRFDLKPNEHFPRHMAAPGGDDLTAIIQGYGIRAAESIRLIDSTREERISG